MINGFQRFIFKLSCILPICIFLAIFFYAQRFEIFFCVCWMVAGLCGGAYGFLFVKLCEKNLPLLEVEVESISQEDFSILICFATYLFPLAGVVWESNAMLWAFLTMGAVLIFLKTGSLGFCPVLLLAGYHCYKAELSTGTTCILISRKREIRSSEHIKQVIRISGTLLLEEKQR